MAAATKKHGQPNAGALVGIPLDRIELGERLRDPYPDDVRAIQASMAQRGLMTPISVRAIEDGRFRIIYGAHRLIAARNLRDAGDTSWNEIHAFILKCDDYEAKMREIDENLARAELTPYDKSTFMEESLRLWAQRYGSSWGGDRKSSSKTFELDGKVKKPEFFRDTAERLGIDETTVRLAVKRRQKASPELWALLRGRDVTRKGVLLDRLLRAKNPQAIIDLADAEHDGSIEAVLNLKEPKKKTAPTVDRVLKMIDDALEVWSAGERRKFLNEMRNRK